MKHSITTHIVHYGGADLQRRTWRLALLAILAFSVTTARAEEWSADGVGQYPPDAASDRIIKWCSTDGVRVRYASANLKIKGYEPCGKLETTATCDASGTRLLSKDDTRPKGHLDCSVGPRIMIVNRGEADTVDQSNMVQPTDTVPPLSAEEQTSLNSEMQRAAKAQQQDPAIQLQIMTNALLQSILGGQTPTQQSRNTSYSRRNKANNRLATDQKRMLEETLRNVDPQTRKMLQQMLQPGGQLPPPSRQRR